MTKIRPIMTLKKGNIKKLKEMSSYYQADNLNDFFFMLAEVDFYCWSPDLVKHKKMSGQKIPKELLDFQYENGITETEVLNEIYLEPQTEAKLKAKSKSYGYQTISKLINHICSYPFNFCSPDIVNESKSKGENK